VTRSDVLHAVSGNPNVTLVGDLVTGQGVPREAFDCMILIQVFPFIYEVRAAIATVFAALRPGGALLATVWGITRLAAMIWSVGVTTGDSRQRRPIDCLANSGYQKGLYGGSPWQCSCKDGVSLWSIER
jgi:hypothetical protein